MENRSRAEILNAITEGLGVVGKIPGNAMPLIPEPDPSEINSKALKVEQRCREKREELIAQLETEIVEVGGRFYKVITKGDAINLIREIVKSNSIRLAVRWDSELFRDKQLDEILESVGVEMVVDSMKPESEQGSGDQVQQHRINLREKAIDAGMGISGVDYALADTGTLVLMTLKGQARSISLLPPIHVAVIKPRQVISGLDDLFCLIRHEMISNGELSNCITFITGPSRTADIELTLTVGVHGPKELHVIMLDELS